MLDCLLHPFANLTSFQSVATLGVFAVPSHWSRANKGDHSDRETSPDTPAGCRTEAHPPQRGASAEDLTNMLGIQPHTARALVSVVRRWAGLTISLKDGRYRTFDGNN